MKNFPSLLFLILMQAGLVACTTTGEQSGQAAGTGETRTDIALSQPAPAAEPQPPRGQPSVAAEHAKASAAEPARQDRRMAETGADSSFNRLYSPASQAMVQRIPTAPPLTEKYGHFDDNPVKLVSEHPVSTFSIDVDTGSYANVRRMLNGGRLPPADAVRVEEMVNYFAYDYPRPKAGGAPFAVHTEMAPAPWNSARTLLRIGIKGKDLAKEALPPANLVFLIDISGSMSPPERLPLLKSAFKLFTRNLRAQDKVSIVVYAAGTGVVLQPTSGADLATINAALDGLHAGGSTHGAAGIELAYAMAQQGYIRGGINRILLATDGDFNVGVTNFETLKSMVAEKRKSGVSLSTLGFGTNNYNDQLMKQLADAGDGKYSYIDSLNEGHKVLVDEFTSTLATIARDVKIQVEFNPAAVTEYRLVGYENRMLKREDFNNDKVDAGDIGAGHTVTALYELTLANQGGGLIDELRYGSPAAPKGKQDELAFIRLRYKEPEAESSRLMEFPVARSQIKARVAQASPEFRFATAVAGFAQILRGSKYSGTLDHQGVVELAQGARGNDAFGHRGEFVMLVNLAESLSTRAPSRRE